MGLGAAAVRNAICRRGLGAGLRLWGRVSRREIRRRARRFAQAQRRLRARYGVAADCPILRWGPEAQARVDAFAKTRPDVRFAQTSGSTATPKRLAYPPDRLRAMRRENVGVLCRLLRRHRVQNPALFVFASLAQDDSLTSLLLEQRRPMPAYLEGLLAPAVYLRHPALQALAHRYGATAVRLWLLVLSNPAMVYSTNPSTLATFLAALHDDWPRSSFLVGDFVHRPGSVPPVVHQIARRVVATGVSRRLEVVLGAGDTAPPLDALLPGLRVYACWDGGYVRPFLDQLDAWLPPERYARIPMYAMSTETGMTLPVFEGDATRFLPLANGVLYEFLPDGAPDEPRRLLEATDLRAGGDYALVVSDGFGLLRYQTRDVFRCVGRSSLGLPDLRFLRRQGLAYSFTGEKLTGEQVTDAFERLTGAGAPLEGAGLHLTCVPCRGGAGELPHYRLILAHPGQKAPALPDLAAIAETFERALTESNHELRSKRKSGRLGPVRAEVWPYDALAARLHGGGASADGDDRRRRWDSQFKLLPLYARLWEDDGPPRRD